MDARNGLVVEDDIAARQPADQDRVLFHFFGDGVLPVREVDDEFSSFRGHLDLVNAENCGDTDPGGSAAKASSDQVFKIINWRQFKQKRARMKAFRSSSHIEINDLDDVYQHQHQH